MNRILAPKFEIPVEIALDISLKECYNKEKLKLSIRTQSSTGFSTERIADG